MSSANIFRRANLNYFSPLPKRQEYTETKLLRLGCSTTFSLHHFFRTAALLSFGPFAESTNLEIIPRSEIDRHKGEPDDTGGVHGEPDELGFVEVLGDLPCFDGVDCTGGDEEHVVEERDEEGRVLHEKEAWELGRRGSGCLARRQLRPGRGVGRMTPE